MSSMAPLRALEEDALARLPGAVEPVPDRRGEGQQPGRDCQQAPLKLGCVRIGYLEAAPERVVMQQQLAQPGPERLDVAQIAEADRAAPDLVLVGRADARAPWCRAWRGRAPAPAPGRARGGSAG